MRTSLFALLIAAPLSLGLSGCVIAIDGDNDHGLQNEHNREFKNRKTITNLALNSQYAQVTQLLGTADFTEAYQVKGQQISVLFYRTQRLHKDGLTTKDECTYLHFENGILTETGAGDNYKRIIAM